MLELVCEPNTFEYLVELFIRPFFVIDGRRLHIERQSGIPSYARIYCRTKIGRRFQKVCCEFLCDLLIIISQEPRLMLILSLTALACMTHFAKTIEFVSIVDDLFSLLGRLMEAEENYLKSMSRTSINRRLNSSLSVSLFQKLMNWHTI